MGETSDDAGWAGPPPASWFLQAPQPAADQAPLAGQPAAAPAPAVRGRPGGPGLTPAPEPSAGPASSLPSSPWVRSHRRWSAAAPGWEDPGPGEVPAPPGHDPDGEAGQGEWHAPHGTADLAAAGDPDGPWFNDPPARVMPRPSFLTDPAQTLLLDADRSWPEPGRRAGRRRTGVLVFAVMVVLAVLALAAALLTGHIPDAGNLAASEQENQPGPAALTLGGYPGQPGRGVFQTVGRVVAYGGTIAAIGTQTSDGITRQQFYVSGGSGSRWRLAPQHAPGGGPAPLGYPAARLAGGPAGWLAVGPQATWTSPNGQSWTLAATRGLAPVHPGDEMWVLNSTSRGFLAAGTNGSQAVIWTSPDGLTWQRGTGPQLGLALPGETVQSISYIASRGADTVIAGTIAKDGTTYSGAWLSTNAGATWTRVTIPVDHGASTAIAGLGFDGSGLIAVRPGRSAAGVSDGVAYFSPDGRSWQYAAAIDAGAAAGWTPGLVKGSDNGVVAVGATSAGQIIAYTSSGPGGSWRPAAPLGEAARETIAGVTTGQGGTVVAVGFTSASQVSQQPVFLQATAAGRVRAIPLASIPGAAISELAVNGLSIAAGQQIAVGSVNGYPAIWRRAGGAWPLVSPPPAAAGSHALRSLTGVTHGPAGWLAVGAPGPVVFTSATGTTWQRAGGPGSIAADLAGVSAVAAAAGPGGYVIVGKLVAPDAACVADVWWSPDLTFWTRARDVNDTAGSSQVLAVAAGSRGFVSVGSHDGAPAIWTTSDGRSWTTIVLHGLDGVLQQVAIDGSRVAALGQEMTEAGPAPLAEISDDGGVTWRQVPFTAAGPDTVFTALTAGPGGFAAASESGPQGQRDSAAWTSATGVSWRRSPVSGLVGGSSQITALASSGSAVTGISMASFQEGRRAYAVTIRPR
jgi:hypothetical protein